MAWWKLCFTTLQRAEHGTSIMRFEERANNPGWDNTPGQAGGRVGDGRWPMVAPGGGVERYAAL
eukprot:4703303-Prymnesium_polylepis.1